mgnify:CR=1 FL=1
MKYTTTSTFSQEELNAAIASVIRNSSKRDCKDAHKIVEAAGYHTFKNHGQWIVSNRETGKSVRADSRWSYRKEHYVYRVCMSGRQYREHEVSNLSVVDFVAFLQKPINEVQQNIDRASWSWYGHNSKSQQQYDRLTEAKWQVKRDGERIEEARRRMDEAMQKLQAEMKRCQDDIAYYTEMQIKDNDKLQSLRVELGLSK